MTVHLHRRMPGVALLALAAVLGWDGTRSAAAQGPDQILVNGKVVTVDGRFSIAQAVAIRGNRFVAIGKDAEVRALAGPATRVVDLRGATVIPGLIDSHGHFVRASRHWSQEVRLDAVRTRAEALALLRDKAKTARPDEWVLTIGGWVEQQFTDSQAGFTRAELDAVSPDKPLFLQVDYAHGYANTLALQRAGIGVEDSASAKQGEVVRGHGQLSAAGTMGIERDAKGVATGRLDGVAGIFRMRGAALGVVAEDRAVASVKAMARDFNRVGLTTVHDLGGGGTVPESYAMVRKVVDAGDLTVRIRYGLWATPRDAAEVGQLVERLGKERPFSGHEFFDLVTLGEIQYNPLVDFPASGEKRGAEHQVQLERVLDAAASRGWPVHMHAHYSGTIAGFLDVIDRVNGRHRVKPLRWQFVHADFVTAAELERMRKLGIPVSVNASSTLTGEVFAKTIGARRKDMPPLRLIQASGVRWALGSDSTAVAAFNPFVTLHWAVTGKGPDGRVVFEQTISREEALVAHTRDAAYFVFEESGLGSIEPGKLADLVVLDRDYLTVPADDIRNIRPTLVMVGGKVAWSR